MKIACLQFAPLVGDTNNNLNRADAVLNRAVDVEGLDLLVLPEMAFSGYNFRSLAHITPYFEPTASGITSLWARTTALKFGCNVIAGYPEKVDVRNNWPASPEFYNSAIFISRDGETIANYRKSFLYAVDEKWALEGPDGFFDAEIDDLGSVTLGICMDLNPYRFEAPWDAFEFANHVLDVRANLVILSMAWLTTEDPETFSQHPNKPDMFTFDYWIQRLEPVITSSVNRHRHRSTGQAPVGEDEEIIVVFCNRCGNEDEALYAGTTAVVGLQNGEVKLYGVLGRGVKELLVVDTDKEPYARIVQNTAGTHDAEDQGDQDNASPSSAIRPSPNPSLYDHSSDPSQQSRGGTSAPGTGTETNYGLNPSIGDTPTSPTSMVALPPSSPNPGGISNGHEGVDRTRFLDNGHLNVNRNSIEFVSPLSTEASWKQWERSAAERLMSLNDPTRSANSNGNSSGNSNRHDEPPNPAISPYNAGLSKTRQNAPGVEAFDNSFPGAFRDAVGSPIPGDSSDTALRLSAALKGTKPVSSSPKQTDKRDSAVQKPEQQRAPNQEPGPERPLSSRRPYSPRQQSQQERLPHIEEKKTKSSPTPPPVFYHTPHNTDGKHPALGLHLHRPRSAVSWDSMAGNSVTSLASEAGSHAARSAHPASDDDESAREFKRLMASPLYNQDNDKNQNQNPNPNHNQAGDDDIVLNSFDEAPSPEDFYRMSSANTSGLDHIKGTSANTANPGSPSNPSNGELVFFLGDDIVDNDEIFDDDGYNFGNDENENDSYSDYNNDYEEEFSNNPAVMSELMLLLLPHRDKAQQHGHQPEPQPWPREKAQEAQEAQEAQKAQEADAFPKLYSSPPSAPQLASPRDRTPMRPGSTKSRNTSRPQASDVQTSTAASLFSRAPSGTRLSRSTSQPQIRDTLSPAQTQPPRVSLSQSTQPSQPRQPSQTRPQSRSKDMSRTNSAQKNPDIALYFRPDNRSRNRSRNGQQTTTEAKAASEAAEARRRHESKSRGSGPVSAAKVHTDTPIVATLASNPFSAKREKLMPKLTTSIPTAAHVHTATPIVKSALNNPFGTSQDTPKSKAKPKLYPSIAEDIGPATLYTPMSARPSSRGRQLDAFTLPAKAETPLVGIASAWPTGRSGNRHVHNELPRREKGRSAGAQSSSHDRGPRRSSRNGLSGHKESKERSDRDRIHHRGSSLDHGRKPKPLETSVDTNQMFCNSIKSGIASPEGISTSFSGHERAASAMSLLSGTSISIASSYMATESWLASTPAPPAIYQQQLLQQHEALQRQERRRAKSQTPHQQQLSPAQPQQQTPIPRSTPASKPVSARPADPDDEIIAMISLVHKGCPVHQHRGRGHDHGHGHGADHGSPAAPLDRNQSRGQDRRLASPSSFDYGSGQGIDGGDMSGDEPGMDDSIYEVILPPHIRNLVETMENPLDKTANGRHRQMLQSTRSESNLSRGPRTDAQRSQGAPRFNPPTPRAMQFTAEVSGEAADANAQGGASATPVMDVAKQSISETAVAA